MAAAAAAPVIMKDDCSVLGLLLSLVNREVYSWLSESNEVGRIHASTHNMMGLIAIMTIGR